MFSFDLKHFLNTIFNVLRSKMSQGGGGVAKKVANMCVTYYLNGPFRAKIIILTFSPIEINSLLIIIPSTRQMHFVGEHFFMINLFFIGGRERVEFYKVDKRF